MLIMNPEILDELTRKHAITLKPVTRWVDIVFPIVPYCNKIL